jgi:hypothetical protein
MKTQRIPFVLILCFLLTLSVCNSTSASTKEQIDSTAKTPKIL